MSTVASNQPLEELHPSIWRASQLGRATTECIDTGYAPLSNQLVGKGWPTGVLVDLLVQQPGIGELRLLGPALARVAHRKIILLQPPHTPNTIALAGLGVSPSDVIWITPKSTADAVWAAEQVLRSGSCGALLYWANQIRSENQRRLHLAAQQGKTLFWTVRPLAAALDASPAPLRLSLRPALGGLEIGFVKRRGPQRDEPLFLPLTQPQPQPQPQPIFDQDFVDAMKKRPEVPAVEVLRIVDELAPI